jgi:2,4-diaminopentanoate dehydrogenase
MDDTHLRVVVWTTGNVIRQAVRAILARPDLELVGAYAHSAAKVGVDVGELCRMGTQLGISATDDVDELLARRPNAVVYSPLHVDPNELARLLRAGVNVVATAELMTATNLGEDVRSALHRAAVDGGATLFGSGMNPGFAQLLAAVSAGISKDVERVRVSESFDVSEFVADANFEAVGWGRPAGEVGHAEDVRAATEVFAEAVEVLGLLLGVDVEDIRCEVAFAHATEDLDLPGMTIASGSVAAMDVNWSGLVGGCEVIGIRQRWVASDRIEPAWTVESGYVVEVTGDPNLRLKLEFWPTDEDLAALDKERMHDLGMRVTAVPVVNAISAVCAARPGIVTYAGLPVITSRLRSVAR